MYRDDASSMARTIARLEAELADYRALGARRRQRILIGVSVVSTVVAVIACLMLRSEAMETEYLNERLAESRAQFAAAKARECASDGLGTRPLQEQHRLPVPGSP
jgi:hypothetical protein